MSDSGFSGLPPRTRISDASYPPGRADLKAQIIAIRGEIKTQKVRQKMEGEIVAHNKDGTTRIKTAKGEITVRIQARDIPTEGSKVTIDLPSGDPPRQLTIQKPSAETTIQKQTPATSQPSETTKAETPVSVTNTATPTRQTEPPLQTVKKTSAPLQEGFSVRLQPALIPALPDDGPPLPPVIALYKNLLALPAPLTIEKGGVTASNIPSPAAFPVPESVTNSTNAAKTPLQNKIKILLSSLPKSLRFAAVRTIQPKENTALANSIIVAPHSLLSLPVTAPLTVQITTIKETSSAPVTPPQITKDTLSSPIPLSGKVIGHTKGNLPVVSLSQNENIRPSLFVLQFNASNLPEGTEISFTPVTLSVQTAPSQTQQAATIAPPLPMTPFLSSFTWPALEELAQTLQQQSPQALQVLAQTTPNPAVPARMAPAALFFVAAIRSGDLQSWLGDKTIDLLRKSGKNDLLSRLGRDISGLSRLSSEPVSQDWRALSLPLYWQDHIEKMQLYYRHDYSQEKDENGQDTKKGTRFLFDLNLNRMGAVQLDGLHRPEEAGGRLDLVVRTEKPLSPLMQKTMHSTYINALEQARVVGELSFQGQPEKFIRINLPHDPHQIVT